jgi:WhiB family transcriptional regulator, redox-sensing transcriptional regulator
MKLIGEVELYSPDFVYETCPRVDVCDMAEQMPDDLSVLILPLYGERYYPALYHVAKVLYEEPNKWFPVAEIQEYFRGSLVFTGMNGTRRTIVRRTLELSLKLERIKHRSSNDAGDKCDEYMYDSNEVGSEVDHLQVDHLQVDQSREVGSVALSTIREHETWRTKGSCHRDSPEQRRQMLIIFYTKTKEYEYAAKKICSGCIVWNDCLKYAIDHNEAYGVWGGTTEAERRSLQA